MGPIISFSLISIYRTHYSFLLQLLENPIFSQLNGYHKYENNYKVNRKDCLSALKIMKKVWNDLDLSQELAFKLRKSF